MGVRGLIGMIQTILYNRENKPITVAVPIGGVLFETCTRTELYWGDGELSAETARHLFRVASGLESPLLGEMAIQGQLKDCYYAAKERWKLSAPINRLFQSAIHTGHRVRTETGIAKGAVSYSQVTVDILCHETDDLTGSVVSIIGVNDMTESILNFLSARGAANIILANRSFDKAQALASKYNAEAIPLEEKQYLLKVSDIVISATSAPHSIIHRSDFCDVIGKRNKQLFFDLAMPQDIDDDVNAVPGVKIYRLAEIEQRAKQNIKAREAEVTHCEEIIEEEINELMRWQRYRVKPPIPRRGSLVI